MITQADYFGAKLTNPEVTPEILAAATGLLKKVNAFLAHAVDQIGYEYERDPDTGTPISGSKGGSGDGGFRLSGSTTGAAKSEHRRAHGIDIYDHGESIDDWITSYDKPNGANPLLEQFGLYREAPAATPGWAHLQDIPPRSGRRTFNP